MLFHFKKIIRLSHLYISVSADQSSEFGQNRRQQRVVDDEVNERSPQRLSQRNKR